MEVDLVYLLSFWSEVKSKGLQLEQTLAQGHAAKSKTLVNRRLGVVEEQLGRSYLAVKVDSEVSTLLGGCACV